MAGSTEGGRTPDKFRVGGGSSDVIFGVTGQNLFVGGENTAMKMNGTIAGDSATGQRKFTARQWAALIGFCGVETRKQVPKIWKQIEKARYATEVRTIVVTSIKEQQVEVDRQSSQVWFGDDVAEDIWKCRFTYG